MNYSAKIDPVIYSPHTGKFGPQDWAALALAAGDQAGLSVKQQQAVQAIFAAKRPEHTVDKFVQKLNNPPSSQPPTNLVNAPPPTL